MSTPADGPLGEILAAARDSIAADTFVGATVSGARRGVTTPAARVTVRPVDLRSGRHLQFTTTAHDGGTVVDNEQPGRAVHRLAALVAEGYATLTVRTTEGDVQLLHSKKGTPRLVRHRASTTEVHTDHDRTKRRLVPEDAPFLRPCGISDADGRVKPSARAKYRQVERFVEILSHTLPDHRDHDAGGDAGRDPDPDAGDVTGNAGDHEAARPFVAVDLGCGAGVLTFAMDHHLRTTLGRPVRTIGVDTKADLLAGRRAITEALGAGPEFVTGTIASAELPDRVDLVVALHACDTATDDALALAVARGARWILAAPCCHHDLQAQLDRAGVPDTAAPLLRHGIVRERLGDLLTDTLRAELLRAEGYRTDVIEFVSTEHTGKNLMIRAVRVGDPDPDAARSADELARTWGVTPALATRLGRRG